MADIGKKIRDYLTDKWGNPVMPSKEKDQIKELEQQEEEDRKRAEERRQNDVVNEYERRRQ